MKALFAGLPAQLKADAADQIIFEAVTWACDTHYEALGIFTEALLRFRKASLDALADAEGE